MAKKYYTHRPTPGTSRKRHRTLTATGQQSTQLKYSNKLFHSLFLSEMIANLERTLGHYEIRTKHNHPLTNKMETIINTTNSHIRMDSSLSHCVCVCVCVCVGGGGGGKYDLQDKSSPQLLQLLKHETRTQINKATHIQPRMHGDDCNTKLK